MDVFIHLLYFVDIVECGKGLLDLLLVVNCLNRGLSAVRIV